LRGDFVSIVAKNKATIPPKTYYFRLAAKGGHPWLGYLALTGLNYLLVYSK
jgi:hypothetical protein